MAAKQKKKKNAKTEEKSPVLAPEVIAEFRPVVACLLMLGAIVGSVIGLEHLRDRVYAREQYNPEPKIELALSEDETWVEAEGWMPRILKRISLEGAMAEVRNSRVSDAPPPGRPDTDNQNGQQSPNEDTSTAQKGPDLALLQAIADQVRDSGWVSEIERVYRDVDGTIRVSCDVRRPIAMLLTPRGRFIPVDRHGYRLPEIYDQVPLKSGWIRIVGVESEMPDPGEQFAPESEDARAAVRMASLLFDQPAVATEIAGIDISNFRGRVDRSENHVVLWTREGRRVDWGSAIGEEIEEPAVGDKLRMLIKFLQEGGEHNHVDVSVRSHVMSAYRDEPDKTGPQVIGLLESQ